MVLAKRPGWGFQGNATGGWTNGEPCFTVAKYLIKWFACYNFQGNKEPYWTCSSTKWVWKREEWTKYTYIHTEDLNRLMCGLLNDVTCPNLLYHRKAKSMVKLSISSLYYPFSTHTHIFFSFKKLSCFIIVLRVLYML